MAERLFQNQLRPQAQPINQFIQPQQFRRAGAAQQPLLGRVSQIATLQQAGSSGVKGFNQFRQMAEALGPLNKNLTSALDKGFKRYAKGSIEAGYYDELRNQQVQGVMNLQQNQEAGAADAASMITSLEKTDPIGASLLREANPWKAIGRRRALAQLAAGQISASLNAELNGNSGVLAGIKPGSAELQKVKADRTKAVLSSYGLTGSEPEAAFYVTPAVNKAWDKFTQEQSKLYNEELNQSVTETTNASVISSLQTFVNDGVTMPDGSVLKAGDPNFSVITGAALTQQIDKGLSLIGGKDRIAAMKKIKESLGTIYGMNIPGIRDAIGQIRLGDKNAPLLNRPRWIDANPFELMDYTNQGLETVKKRDELEQSEKERRLQAAAIDPETGIVGITDEAEYRRRAANLRRMGLEDGLRDTDKVLSDVMSENDQVNEEQYAIPFEQQAEFVETFETLTPKDVSPQNYPALVQKARIAASLEPNRENRVKKFAEYMGKINSARETFGTLPTGAALQSNLSRSVKEDLNDPEIAKLKGSASASFIDGLIQLQGAEATPSSQRYVEYANEVRGLYESAIWNKFTEYRDNNDGVKNIPLDVQARLRGEAVESVRKSKAYEKAKEAALAKVPAPTGSDGTPKGAQIKPETTAVPMDAANTITDEQAKQFRTQKVMGPHWVRTEMGSLANGKSVSPRLYDLATKAGTSTDRYLLEQLSHYAKKLDPDGKFRGVLQERIERARQSNTPAAANFDAATDPMGNQSYSGRSPGAWLMSMFERPAAAGTLPPSIRSIPSFQRSGSSTPKVQGNWYTPSGYEIVQYVTGDVTAPHDGDAVVVDPHGHGGEAYHNHYEFATVAGRKRAAAAFRAAGFRVTSEERPGDPGSHGVGRGLDVAPGWSSRMPGRLPDTQEAEARWSQAANAILGFTP